MFFNDTGYKATLLIGSVLKATIVALRKMREATIVALMALRVLLIHMRISC